MAIIEKQQLIEMAAKKAAQAAFVKIRQDVNKTYREAAKEYLYEYFYKDFNPKSYQRTYNFRENAFYTTTNQSFYMRGRIGSEERIVSSYNNLIFSSKRMKNYGGENPQKKEDVFEWNFFYGYHGAYRARKGKNKGKVVVIHKHGRYKRVPGGKIPGEERNYTGESKQLDDFMNKYIEATGKMDAWKKQLEAEIKNALPPVWSACQLALQSGIDKASKKAMARRKK